MQAFRRKVPGIGRTIALAASMVLGACGGSDGGPMGGEGTTVEVQLFNHDSSELPIHILAPGEDFDESNRLEPGGERTVQVAVPDLLVIEFRAGRNGIVGATIFCALIGDEDQEAFVLFFMEGLSCGGALEAP